MTFYTPVATGNPDDVEIGWHGGPREQGDSATARHADGSMEAVNAPFGRYEQACGASDISEAGPVQQERPEAPHGPVNNAPQEMRTILVRGVQMHVDPTKFDDFDLLDSLAKVQSGDVLVLPALFRTVAGDKAQELLDAARDETGRVTATAASEMIVEIMKASAPKA